MANNTKAIAAAAVALSGVLTLGAVPQAQAASVGSARAVTAIGDSYPAGGYGNEGNSYVERYGRRTGQRPHNFAVGGWTTRDVQNQINGSAIERRNLRDSRTVIVTIGANDISMKWTDPSPAAYSFAPYNNELHAMRSRLHNILGTISRQRGGNNSRVVVTTYNNIYTDGQALSSKPWAYRSGAIRLTGQVNGIIMAECKAYKMSCVDVRPNFDSSMARATSLTVTDGTHPNSKGHDVYASLIYNKVH